MEQKQVDQIMMMHSSKLAPEYIEAIRERLLELDNNQAMIAFSDVKDPTIMLVISIFLGGLGIDRFIIGDVALGAGKLVLWIAGWFLCFVTWIVSIPWWVVDLFLIMGATRKYNAQKVLERLAMLG